MSGFVASARLERVRPHVTRIDRDRVVWSRPPAARDADDEEGIVVLERTTTAANDGPTLAERWHDLRERWAETTFFLFDADSWR
jgi:hypothetical protein